jgi:hypothetical protein
MGDPQDTLGLGFGAYSNLLVLGVSLSLAKNNFTGDKRLSNLQGYQITVKK